MVTIEEILEIGKKAEKLVNGPQKEWTEFVNRISLVTSMGKWFLEWEKYNRWLISLE